jgi:hypothetical protein
MFLVHFPSTTGKYVFRLRIRGLLLTLKKVFGLSIRGLLSKKIIKNRLLVMSLKGSG